MFSKATDTKIEFLGNNTKDSQMTSVVNILS